MPLLLAAVVAAAAPSLLAYNVSPSPTFLNQALALLTWGGFALLLALDPPACRHAGRAAWPLQVALALLMLAALGSFTVGALPSALGVSALGLLAAAALLAHSGAAARCNAGGDGLFACFAWGWLVAGLLNLALALVQVFAPGWADGDWIAASGIVGRAVGNLRQPNHLSSVLLWAAIAVVALLELHRLQRAAGALAFAGLIFGVVLTASRTGLVSVGILAAWGALDRRLSRAARGLLLAAPAIYALAWSGMDLWALWGHHTFGGAARLAETDVSGSRFGIWANTLALIEAQPWMGVGFGEFNLAWTLTPFPGRPTAFFDHTHNLPLQLAVELGLPLAALVLALLIGGLARMLKPDGHFVRETLALLLLGPVRIAWLIWRTGRDGGHHGGRDGDDDRRESAITRRAAFMFVLMIGLHSLLEYPLWYAYFLLPTAWAFGFGLGRPAGGAPSRAGLPLRAPAALLLMAGAAYAVWDYGRVSVIFSAADDAPPLAQRIAHGQHSTFFAHHADYAAATTEIDPRLREHAFDRATHYLLDTRLMMAWAEDLARRGDLDRARYLAARLREFRNPLSEDWFAACDAVALPITSSPPAPPFQCAPPAQAHDWREFLPPRRAWTPSDQKPGPRP
jgi:O-antigen ligase